MDRVVRIVSAAGCAAIIAGLLAPQAARAGTETFEHERFSFSFRYHDSWIPRVNIDGESVTFARSAGEILISVERARNPQRFETSQELADDLVETLRDRVVFEWIKTRDTKLDGLPTVLVSGMGKLYDAPLPYRVAIYVTERDGKFYLVKFSGLYDKNAKDYQRFQSLAGSVRFDESSE